MLPNPAPAEPRSAGPTRTSRLNSWPTSARLNSRDNRRPRRLDHLDPGKEERGLRVPPGQARLNLLSDARHLKVKANLLPRDDN